MKHYTSLKQHHTELKDHVHKEECKLTLFLLLWVQKVFKSEGMMQSSKRTPTMDETT